MLEQPLPTGAVFLSYASEDADAAARICEALRAAGVEVWFDRSELRGGDAWDSQIKKQIHDCALFLPVISAHTNARTEGYFRREWKLATRRLLDIADDAAFLVPVVIDETHDAHARVPEEFQHVQWTRLPGGETPAEFAKRVRQLLGADDVGAIPALSTVNASVESRAGMAHSHKRKAPPVRLVALALVALLVLGGGVYWYFQGGSNVPTTMPAPSAAAPVVVAAPNEKSIAVLPFVNMSSDKDQDYFADGIAEELLNLLAQVPDLKVIARTSSFAFKGEKIDIAEIAKKLNVAHVVEGSLRKSGNKLRITAQLVRTADSTHLWSETYDRPLDDIFAVQDEIANAIVQALQIKMLGGKLSRREGGTQNLEAYQLYMRAQEAIRRNTKDSLDAAERHAQRAVNIDPEFGLGWDSLADVAALRADNGYVGASEGYEQARRISRHALEVSPGLIESRARLGYILNIYDWNWPAADAELTEALAMDPANTSALIGAGKLDYTLGRWDEAERKYLAALERDPLDPYLLWNLGHTYYLARRYEDSERTYRRLLETTPSFGWTRPYLGKTLLALGRQREGLKVVEEATDELDRLLYLPILLQANDRPAEAEEALARQIEVWGDVAPFYVALTYAHRRAHDRAIEWLERAYSVRDPALVEIVGETILDGMADDPRYRAFLRKMNLPD